MTTEHKEKPKSHSRLDRLREIEIEMQAKWAADPFTYQNADAPEDY